MTLEQTFLFQITPLDITRLRPQVSRALEKRAELISRQKCPRMWELTDKLNSVERVPQAVRENRRKRRGFLGLLNWMLGVVLLMPGLMEPAELIFPLLVGALGFGTGTVSLWRNKRTLLGILSLVLSVLLCMGVWGNFERLGGWLPLGIAALVIGIAALLTRKREKKNPFDRAAEQLLQGKAAEYGQGKMQVCVSSRGMTAGMEEGEKCKPLCASFDFVLETEDLLLPIFDDSVVILQKKDLLTGTIFELRELLSEQTQYIRLDVRT